MYYPLPCPHGLGSVLLFVSASAFQSLQSYTMSSAVKSEGEPWET
jgi:hypothetical protein